MPEPRYHLRPAREFRLLGAGLALIGLAVYLDRRDDIPVFRPMEATDGGLLPDRLAYLIPNAAAARLADVGLFGGPTLPLLLSLHPRARPDYPVILLIWLETLLLNFALTSVIKNSANRPRPYVYDENWNIDQAMNRNDRAAFLSGHASHAAAGSLLFARLLGRYAPRYRNLAWAWAGGVGGFTAFLRVRAAKHWPTDALAGLLLGAGVATYVERVHRGPPDAPGN